MMQADQIRQFVLNKYIGPARSSGCKEVTLRAGDVHKEMGLISRMPAVCSALEGKKLCDLAGISVKQRHGPPKGSNVYVTYDLDKREISQIQLRPNAKSVPVKPKSLLKLNPATSLILVSCVKSKLTSAARAQDLYTSTLFLGGKSFARSTGAPWFILSSKYGLVHPDMVIEPYEYTLKTLGIAERRAWARKVLNELRLKLEDRKQVVILAGERYREFLIEPLERQGLEVLVPMAGLRFGEQLQWLSEHSWTDR